MTGECSLPLRRLLAIGPLVLYAGVIFGGSSDEVPSVITSFEIPDYLLHTIEFAIFGFLASRWLFVETGDTGAFVLILLPTLIAAAYGGTDELHQAFVPGRFPASADLLADTLGGLLGAALHRSLCRVRSAPRPAPARRFR